MAQIVVAILQEDVCTTNEIERLWRDVFLGCTYLFYYLFLNIVLFQVYRTDTYITYSTGIILTLRVLVLLNNTYVTVQLHQLRYSLPIYHAWH